LNPQQKIESSAAYKDKYFLQKCIKEGKNIFNENEPYKENEENELSDDGKEFKENG
jgi:hypothetical protein